jgi:hypothetical protein
MPQGRGFLERFRPVGTPGAAAARGVPADRVAELAAELAPVFDLLEPTQKQSVAIRAQADDEADRHRAAALEGAAAKVGAARRHAESERAATAAGLARAADVEAEQILAAARRDADAVREAAARRLPDLAAAARSVMAARLADLVSGER